jgi:MFS superfamily sulfate permease-like transporter
MKALIQQNRMILSFLNQSFEIRRLRENLANLAQRIQFVPDTLIVDGLDFSKASEDLFEEFQEIARTFHVEIWFSALSHKHIADMNQRGIPYPCNHVDHLFSIILQLEPSQSGILLKLLKDHGNPVSTEAHVRLDPQTFMVTAPISA